MSAASVVVVVPSGERSRRKGRHGVIWLCSWRGRVLQFYNKFIYHLHNYTQAEFW